MGWHKDPGGVIYPTFRGIGSLNSFKKSKEVVWGKVLTPFPLVTPQLKISVLGSHPHGRR